MGDQDNQDNEVRISSGPIARVQAKEFKKSLQPFACAIQEGAPKIIDEMAVERRTGCTFIQVTQDSQNTRIKELDSEQPHH